MVEQRQNYRSYDPDIDGYEESRYREEPTDHRVTSYRFGPPAHADSHPDKSVPLFLSDYDGEPDPSEYYTPVRMEKTSISSRMLGGVLVAAAAAILFALFSSDAMRGVIVNAKASIATVLPSPSEAAQPNVTRLTASDIQLKDQARLGAPANRMSAATGMAAPNVTLAAVTPSRAEITSAYQSALQGQAPATALVAPVAPPTARKLGADELATLMNRAKGLLAAGDIPPARLLLERAADAQEPSAALTLAQTYDPDVLGTQDARNINPDPAAARAWYLKAAQLGSADAQRRLTQLQN
jgi:TPR repeat protein